MVRPSRQGHGRARRSCLPMAPATKRSPARRPARRRPARGRARTRRARPLRASLARLSAGAARLRALDERDRDALGLALIAAGVFLGFVLYGGWNGGHAGGWLASALGWLLGRARDLAPVAL